MHSKITTHYHAAAIIHYILVIVFHLCGKFKELFLIFTHKTLKLLLSYQHNRLLRNKDYQIIKK